MKCPSYELFFKNMSSKVRIKILNVLKDGPLNVTNICEKTKEEQSKISHNLKILLDCNIIEVQKMGKNRVYSVNKETIEPLLGIVESHVKKNCKDCNQKCLR